MNRREVLELKKRFKKDDVTISKVAGCYVDSNKDIISTFKSQMLTMDDEDFFKFLDIAKKSLSGKIGNNLLNIEFPLDEEKSGGRQQSLMALRDSDLDDDSILNAYYEHIIETYDNPGHYLIVLFLDNYDVITKAEDNAKLDESEEVYKYVICAICPVDLSKAALGYNEIDNKIVSRERDWVVGAPESAFLFPAFNDRSTDIHSALFYTKKSRDIHTEFIENGLGCKPVKSSDLKRDELQSAIANNISGDDDSDSADVESTIMSVYMNVTKLADDCDTDLEEYKLTEDAVEKVLVDSGLSKFAAKSVRDECSEIFDDSDIHGSDIVDEKYMKKNELLIDYKELAAENAKLSDQLNEKYSINDLRNKLKLYNGSNDIDEFIKYLES